MRILTWYIPILGLILITIHGLNIGMHTPFLNPIHGFFIGLTQALSIVGLLLLLIL